MKPNPQVQDRSKLIKLAGVVLLVFMCLALVSWWLSYGRAITQKPELEKYLNEKYAQEFTVRDLKERGGELGGRGLIIGIAVPVDESGLTFDVGTDPETGNFFDGYSEAVWQKEDRPRVASFLKTVYDAEIPDFLLRAHIITPNTPDPIGGEVPPIDDAIARYKNNFSYDITINLFVPNELSQNELREHTNKMKQIISFVLSKGVSSPGVRYAINIKGQEKSYLCNLYKDELTNSSKIDACLKLKNGKAW